MTRDQRGVLELGVALLKQDFQFHGPLTGLVQVEAQVVNLVVGFSQFGFRRSQLVALLCELKQRKSEDKI